MTEGPILSRLFRYLIPFVIVNFTQILYNAIDVAILGNFSGDDAVAAVGATSCIIFLLNAAANGLSSGINIVVARCVGSKEMDRARQSTGTALLSAAVGSTCAAVIIFPFVPTFLLWMNCDPLVLDTSAIYLRILLLSIPFQWVYNFLASAIRATGDSARPMTMMLVAGGFKVGFNLLFVGLLQLGVVGAGLSTILAQMIAAGQALFAVIRRRDTWYTLERRYIRIRKPLLLDIVRFGVPASLSSTFFYIASAVIQSCVNSMGKSAMTANTISSQLDAFVYNVGVAVATATMAFVSQNIGAGNYRRVKKIIWISLLLATFLSLALGSVIALFADELCSITTDNPEIIALAKERLILYCFTYFTSSAMGIVSNALIAMGYTRNHLFVSLFVGLGFRVLWAKAVWPIFGTLRALYTAIPLSCTIGFAEYLIVLCIALPKLKARLADHPAAADK